MSPRVYVPLPVTDLAALAEQGSLPAGRAAFAVTDADRRSDPQADEEELEYHALNAAADAAQQPGPGARPAPRVVVAAADVDGPDPADVPFALGRPLGIRDVVSFHVTGAGASEDEELLWYDVTELPPLLAELRGGPLD